MAVATPAAAQTISRFPIITTINADPNDITTGPDGALWFTEPVGNKIGRITTSGAITEFVVPTVSSGPAFITSGPDGALWFTESYVGKIGRISTTATVANPQITEFPITNTASAPNGITGGRTARYGSPNLTATRSAASRHQV